MKGIPKHPFRIALALIFSGIGSASGNLVLQIILLAAALELLWEL